MASGQDPAEGFVAARVGKPHGLRGEVTVQVHTDDPERRFVPGAVFPTEPSERGPLTLRSVRVHQGTYLLAFDGRPDRTAAEALRGTRLLVTDDDPDVDDDGWREEDLLGFEVVLPDGSPLGTVSALHLRPVQDLLEVRTVRGEVLVPFVEELVPEVDEEQRRVVVDPPPGLLELGEGT
ncbi:ribosome maturation factor RimM [Ornithinimicrobium pekingense]|uniref:Ribosome maturation factor RimM n=1 Tax=Ornithinimicrobium pekingense TaxID=384677 RepID=A0ABQ2F5D0_9MICO|nr:ribosome maturation factor RimM [Ornithinimicrobium pekingense]GGK62579.1 ribosome maturation factor RimM [Ornithinimicrobium pekingense]